MGLNAGSLRQVEVGVCGKSSVTSVFLVRYKVRGFVAASGEEISKEKAVFGIVI